MTIYEFIRAHWNEPFEWHRNDCVLFTARALDAQHGTDFEQRVRERFEYASEREALGIIANAGGLEGLVSEYLGPSVPWSRTRPGDALLCRVVGSDRLECVGIRLPHQLVTRTEHGTIALPLNWALKGWVWRAR